MSIIHTMTFLFTIHILITHSRAANILGIFQIPSYSHQQPFLALSYALGARGHNLTILTTNPSDVPMKNVREIDFSSLYDDWIEMQSTGSTLSLQTVKDPLETIWGFFVGGKYMTGATINKSKYKDFLREINGTKHDLILCEGYYFAGLLGVYEITGKPPIVAISSSHLYPVTNNPIGNPITSSYIPNVFLGLSDRMNIWERFKNLYTNLYSLYIIYLHDYPTHQEYLTEVYGDLPYTIKDLLFNISLLLVTTDLINSYPRPIHPNTVYVGPLHIEGQIKPLPQDLQKWMDSAEDGVIYFSLGGNMKSSSLPENIIAAFIKAFEQFPKMKILWKWEAETKIPGQNDNILAKEWFPQKSILAHPKLKIFINQCGLQSIQEAIYYAVPVIGIPLFADQFYNSKKVMENGIGLQLSFNDITYEEVYEKLSTILTNPRYKENALRISTISKDKPMSSIDTAIWWVEYVLRHKGAHHLRPACLDLTWYQYYMIDILFFVIVFVFVILCLFYYVANKLNNLVVLYLFYKKKNYKTKFH